MYKWMGKTIHRNYYKTLEIMILEAKQFKMGISYVAYLNFDATFQMMIFTICTLFYIADTASR